VLFGNKGNDYLNGKEGDDTLIAGAGRDRLYGGDGNDTLFGESGRDILWGGKGDDALLGGDNNDRLFAGDGNDTLFGGSGRDRLFGNTGNDTLYGGGGNDYLEGGYGDDTYIFGKGDGKDTIRDFRAYRWFKRRNDRDAGYDTIRFDESISIEDIAIYGRGSTLKISYSDQDLVTILGQSSKSGQIERIELADGHYLLHSDLELIVQQINAYARENGIFRLDGETIKNNEELMNIVMSAWKEA
jgi:hypothetical protein